MPRVGFFHSSPFALVPLLRGKHFPQPEDLDCQLSLAAFMPSLRACHFLFCITNRDFLSGVHYQILPSKGHPTMGWLPLLLPHFTLGDPPPSSFSFMGLFFSPPKTIFTAWYVQLSSFFHGEFLRVTNPFFSCPLSLSALFYSMDTLFTLLFSFLLLSLQSPPIRQVRKAVVMQAVSLR